jgi:hypothetical protein
VYGGYGIAAGFWCGDAVNGRQGGFYAGHFRERSMGRRDAEYILGVIAVYVCDNDIE